MPLAKLISMIYLDANATTPVRPEVWDAMRPFAVEHFGNPASAHRFGRLARKALAEPRPTGGHISGDLASGDASASRFSLGRAQAKSGC